MAAKYTVYVVRPRTLTSWPYQPNYFPRSFHYLKDAKEAARAAKICGARDVEIKMVKSPFFSIAF